PDPVPPKPPQSENSDPLLESLLAKARPIIATERGLNYRSRAKIQSLGKKMKIPGAVIDQALQLLHGAPPAVGTATSRHERGFAKIMEQKISQIPGKILTTRIEEKAISIGTRKHQLSETQARNIVRRVAEEVNVPRVTLNEAEKHIEQEIADLFGETSRVSVEKKQRLIRNGKRLGVSREQTQSMIQRHLQFNFRQAQSERNLTERLWVISAVLIVGTGFSLFVFTQLQQAKRENEAAQQSEKRRQLTAKPNNDLPDVGANPQWWDDSLKLLLQKTRLKVNGFPDLHDRMKSRDPLSRASAYRDVFSLGDGVINPTVTRQRVSAVIPKLYQSDPSLQATTGMLNGFTESIQMQTGTLPKTADFFSKAFWALSLLNDMVGDESMSDEKVLAIQKMMEPVSGRKFDLFLSAGPRLRKQRQALIETYFKNLVNIGPSYPDLAPEIFAKLEALTKNRIQENKLQELRYLFLNTFLGFDIKQWPKCAKLIEKSILDSNLSHVSFFIDLMETTPSESLQAYLKNALFKQAGLATRTETVTQSATRLRDYFEISVPKKVSPEMPRRAQVDPLIIQYTDKWLDRPTQLDNRELAELLAESCYLATLMWLLNSETGEPFEKLIAAGFPSIDDPNYLTRITGSSSKETEMGGETDFEDQPGGASQRFARERIQTALKQLNQFKILTSTRRITAINLVQKTAPSISRLSGFEANILAEYLLSRKNSQENENVLAAIPSFRHWPRLVIAVSDQLRQKPFPHKTSLDVSSLLLNEDLKFSGPGWPTQLSQHLFVTGMHQLEIKQSGMPEKQQVDPVVNLKVILSFLYRLRAQSLQLDTSLIAHGNLESIMDLCLKHYQGQLTALEKNSILEEMERNRTVQEALGTDPLTRLQLKQAHIITCLEAIDKPTKPDPSKTEALLKLNRLVKNRFAQFPSIVGQIAENEIKILLFYYRHKLK
ncbi:MAG: hypothetical protein VX438_08235, partial [Planctomycetota bacterium]|nr:hypothetical protein [Planctomycetota bacterium]